MRRVPRFLWFFHYVQNALVRFLRRRGSAGRKAGRRVKPDKPPALYGDGPIPYAVQQVVGAVALYGVQAAVQNHLPRRRTDGTGSGTAQIAAAIQVHAAALPAGVNGAACAAVAAGGSLYHAFAMYCQGRTVGQLYRAFQAVAAGVGVGSAVGSGVAVGSAVGDGVAAGSSAVRAAGVGAAASRVSGLWFPRRGIRGRPPRGRQIARPKCRPGYRRPARWRCW